MKNQSEPCFPLFFALHFYVLAPKFQIQTKIQHSLNPMSKTY